MTENLEGAENLTLDSPNEGDYSGDHADDQAAFPGASYPSGSEDESQEADAEESREHEPAADHPRFKEVVGERNELRDKMGKIEAENQEMRSLLMQMAQRSGVDTSGMSTGTPAQRAPGGQAPWLDPGFEDEVLDNPSGAFAKIGDYVDGAVERGIMGFAQSLGQFNTFSQTHADFSDKFQSGEVHKAMQRYGTTDPYQAYLNLAVGELREQLKTMKGDAEKRGREGAEQDVRLRRESAPAHGTPRSDTRVTPKTDISKLSGDEWRRAMAAKLNALGGR